MTGEGGNREPRRLGTRRAAGLCRPRAAAPWPAAAPRAGRPASRATLAFRRQQGLPTTPARRCRAAPLSAGWAWRLAAPPHTLGGAEIATAGCHTQRQHPAAGAPAATDRTTDRG